MEDNSGKTVLDACFADDLNQTASLGTRQAVAMASKNTVSLSIEIPSSLTIF